MFKEILNKKIRNTILIIVFGILVIGVVFLRLLNDNIEPPTFIHPKVLLNPPEQIYNAPLPTEEDHLWGNTNAPVKIIEYSDTECPYCKINYFNMKFLVNKYDGDVAWVYRHHTLDHRFTKSRKEAEASECAAQVGGEGAFWLFLDGIFTNTQSGDTLDLSLLPEFASNIGINKVEFEQCLENGDTAEIVERQNLEASRSGLEYTPSTIVIWPDGKRRSVTIGARNRETMIAMLDYILGRETEEVDIFEKEKTQDNFSR